MKLKSLFVLSLAVFCLLSWKFVDSEPVADPDNATLLIRLRSIGHQLLLSVGDSSSRILPVQEIGSEHYKIRFESTFELEPDTLVMVVNKAIGDLEIQSGYLVNVLKCSTSEIVYGFEIHGEARKDVVPCLGRPLPEACYEISVQFSQNDTELKKYAPLAASFLGCLLFAILVLKKKTPVQADNDDQLEFLQLGQFRFYPQRQILKWGNKEFLLTSKENQVLEIFASNPNQIVDRNQLQKEVWENEGVVVGRSLDVFISKLRKKLEADPALRIVNIHGRGYKLEVREI
ncbi:MAG: hypothetical protein DHS20C17_28930 [Cyclobacteriaceae bacterium]|nr:MAG: hypothetical protein DHS20C17_28930 [Cyclobacteriaceae bacterium]